MRGDTRLMAACALVLLTFATFSQAGPVSRSSRMLGMDRAGADGQTDAPADDSGERNISTNMSSEAVSCSVGDIVYRLGEAVPGSEPCETCNCSSNGIQCEPQICEVRPGCVPLHRADSCCPLYQCECERDGMVYTTGEKLKDPLDPCRVCYCQGGEIVCNQVACFRRDDCEPKYVDGYCCPQYYHCPPRVKEYMVFPEKFRSGTKYRPEDPEPNKKYRIKPDYSKIAYETPEVTEPEDNTNVTMMSIKEVVSSDKPQNKEIRITEVLPTTSFDIASLSTKSPTFPREATYSNEKIDGSKTDVSKNSDINKGLNHEEPPVLRIGDQLLFLKQGDLVPENAAVSTPSSVFTVIGAEGLQRVVEEPEKTFDHKNSKADDDMKIEVLEEVLVSLNDSLELIENTTAVNESVTADESIDNLSNETLEINQTVTEDLNKILQEVISELYETTTSETTTSKYYYENDNTSNDADLLNNFITTKLNTNTELSSTQIFEVSTEETIHAEDKLITDQTLDEEQQSVPIEHLPEHNPEYPPIPEDIMSLGMTEDSLESGSSEMEFSGVSPTGINERKEEEKIVLAKRPVLSASLYSKQNKNNDTYPEKIFPDVLHLVRMNKTNDTYNLSTATPEEWLKNSEKQTNAYSLNSPLITLGSALPENILSSPSSKEISDDGDSKEYIFVANETNNFEFNTSDLGKIEISTEDPLQPTDIVEIEGEFRSPGEPLLIPEWERNQTEVPDIIKQSESSEESNENSSENPVALSVSDKQTQTDELDTAKDKSGNHIYVESITDIDIRSSTENYQQISDLNQSSGDDESSKESTEVTPKSGDARSADITVSSESITQFFSDEPISTKTTIVQKPLVLRDAELVPDLISESMFGPHTKKQKKTASPLAAEVKNDNSNELTKKGNILADLINLVGVVASIGNHEVEVSSVHNSIDFERPTEAPLEKVNAYHPQEVPVEQNKVHTNSHLSAANVEFSEFDSTPQEHTIVEAVHENDKVEVTTKVILIDNDSDERNKWKSTDDIIKDIEIIPKVPNKSKQNSREKIISDIVSKNLPIDTQKKPDMKTTLLTTTTTKLSQSNTPLITTTEEVIIYTTIQQTTPPPITKNTPTVPQKETKRQKNTKPPVPKATKAPLLQTTKVIQQESTDLSLSQTTEASFPETTDAPPTTKRTPRPKTTRAPRPKTTQTPRPKLTDDGGPATEAPLPKPTKTPQPKTTRAPRPKTTRIPKTTRAPKTTTTTTEPPPEDSTLELKQETTEAPTKATSTVMKVSVKSPSQEDDPLEKESDESGRDKLTKRETNSQLTDSSGQIDESLISILRDFFEKQYRH